MKLTRALKRSLGNAADRYHAHVDRAASYLEERGLWDDGIVEKYRLGVVVDPTPEHEYATGRLSIPYITPTGVVNLKFRCIKGHDCKAIGGHAKYIGIDGLEDRVYNVQALHDATDVVYVAEGELDALSATEAGYPCVGVSGARKWQDHYTRLFEDFAEVVVFAEGDDDGRDFGRRVRDELDNARVVQLPDGEDVNSLLAGEDFTIDDFAALVAS